MKFTKREIIWLVVEVLAWLVYVFPGLPAYGDAVGCIVHGFCCFVFLFVWSFGGYAMVCKHRKIKNDEKLDQ